MKTIIIDENIQSKELTLNILKSIQDVEITGQYDSFNNEINYNAIDLIVFDINSKNSIETLDKINTLKKQYKNLYFIALSYEINSQLVSQILKNGVNDFLLKPILPTILETSIKKININKEILIASLSLSENYQLYITLTYQIIYHFRD